MAVTLEEADEVIRIVNEESIPLQIGFNRRFAKGFRSAYEEIRAGKIGTPQLMRSITRDPALGDPTPIPQWTIFLETLIHDFDTLLYLNPNAKPIEVYAAADALVRPDFKDKGFWILQLSRSNLITERLQRRKRTSKPFMDMMSAEKCSDLKAC